ncbi:Putative transcriptional regulator, TetR family [Mycobacteroides abscessus subsp. abscessus]|nr:Putative transcriptional regulator, TetR family [Mycobacteroides abscessus subsp. abscessus]
MAYTAGLPSALSISSNSASSMTNESLTMRRLADRLPAHLPTIYRLVDGKDALFDEMAEAILAKALDDAPTAPQDWADRVKSLAAGPRSALLSRRDGARIVGGNYAAKRANLTFIDTLVGSVQAGGLAHEHALWAASSLLCSYVLGEVLEQQGAAGGETETLEGCFAPGTTHTSRPAPSCSCSTSTRDSPSA